jgi:hypothetical protein
VIEVEKVYCKSHEFCHIKYCKPASEKQADWVQNQGKARQSTRAGALGFSQRKRVFTGEVLGRMQQNKNICDFLFSSLFLMCNWNI